VAKKAKLYNTRELTNHLRTFAADIEDTFINDEGEAVLVTKAEMLAKRVWQAALGRQDQDQEGLPQACRMGSAVHLGAVRGQGPGRTAG
jgi:hypothetical protein